MDSDILDTLTWNTRRYCEVSLCIVALVLGVIGLFQGQIALFVAETQEVRAVCNATNHRMGVHCGLHVTMHTFDASAREACLQRELLASLAVLDQMRLAEAPISRGHTDAAIARVDECCPLRYVKWTWHGGPVSGFMDYCGQDPLGSGSR